MSIKSQILGALREVEKCFPNQAEESANQFVLRNDVPIACTASAFEHQQTWQDSPGGGMYQYEQSFTIRTDELASKDPVVVISENDNLVYKDRDLHVIKIIEEPTEAFIRVLCNYGKAP